MTRTLALKQVQIFALYTYISLVQSNRYVKCVINASFSAFYWGGDLLEWLNEVDLATVINLKANVCNVTDAWADKHQVLWNKNQNSVYSN